MSKHRPKGTGTLFKRSQRGSWIASWFDHAGKRAERSTRTTDKAAAERILSKRVAGAALRREGVIDARQDRFAIEGRKPLGEHVADYITHCRQAGHAERHVEQKGRHLARLCESTGATRLPDLTADALERHLATIRAAGLSARSINFARQIAVAFTSWCVKTGRVESNPLKVVPKLDERNDRRRTRRPMTDDEMARLLVVARERGREAWYLAAALAGLRKGDLQRLTWTDIDFDAATITLRGKSKRVDTIPMHPQLADVLKRRQSDARAVGPAKVFTETVTDITRIKDFLRAGIARCEVVKGADGQPVMVGKGKRRRPLTRIVAEDADGRVIDLHALRTTLGTRLARAGVAPQIAQRIMRHSDYRTTLRHYTVLGLTDTAAAVERLPSIDAGEQRHAATGTDGCTTDDPQRYPRQLPRQFEREAARVDATARDDGRNISSAQHTGNTEKTGGFCDTARSGATLCADDAGVAQLVERQPSKLKKRRQKSPPDQWLQVMGVHPHSKKRSAPPARGRLTAMTPLSRRPCTRPLTRRRRPSAVPC